MKNQEEEKCLGRIYIKTCWVEIKTFRTYFYLQKLPFLDIIFSLRIFTFFVARSHTKNVCLLSKYSSWISLCVCGCLWQTDPSSHHKIVPIYKLRINFSFFFIYAFKFLSIGFVVRVGDTRKKYFFIIFWWPKPLKYGKIFHYFLI